MSKVFSDFKFWPITSPKRGSLRANGQVTVSNTVVVKFTISEGNKGLFAGLPSDKKPDPENPGQFKWYPHVRFPNDEVFNEFRSLTVKEYEKSLSSTPGTTSGDAPTDEIPF